MRTKESSIKVLALFCWRDGRGRHFVLDLLDILDWYDRTVCCCSLAWGHFCLTILLVSICWLKWHIWHSTDSVVLFKGFSFLAERHCTHLLVNLEVRLDISLLLNAELGLFNLSLLKWVVAFVARHLVGLHVWLSHAQITRGPRVLDGFLHYLLCVLLCGHTDRVTPFNLELCYQRFIFESVQIRVITLLTAVSLVTALWIA